MNLKKKRYPLFVMVIADILLTGVILCTFSYFHHVRMLWGVEDKGSSGKNNGFVSSFTKKENDKNKESQHLTHDWVLDEIFEKNCTEGGYKKYICECGESKYDERTQPTGHQELELRGAYDATYEENGFTGDLYCNDCGEIVVNGCETPAKCHENVTLINERESTCFEKGYFGDWYCYDCEEIVAYGSETPLAAHFYTEKGKFLPTCAAEGYTLYECLICGAERKNDHHPRIDHVLGEGGKCSMCGVIMLDISGDFGASFPIMFLQNADKITLTEDSGIREYAESQGITLIDHEEGKYISLYRSHDIFVSILEVNTEIYDEDAQKSYKVQYYVYDIYVRNIENLFTSYNASGRKSAEDLIKSGEETFGGDVIAAMNGDYMGNKNKCLVCVRNGDALRLPDYIESDACVIYFDGTMETVSPADYDKAKISAKNPYQIWNFGPGLIDSEGKAIEEYSGVAYDDNVKFNRHPRASMGYYEPGHYNFIVVDGRSKDSNGITMVELAKLHEEYKSVVAYNMDGGDSAQAFFEDTDIRISEAKGDDQRKLYDIICIGEVSSE